MASLSIPAGMTEKEYLRRSLVADFLRYKEQDPPTYETPRHSGHGGLYCFVDGKSVS